MSLSPEERQVMSNLEMERAERILREEVPVQQQAHLWNMLANRLYYAVFHAVSALLIKNSLYANSHKGCICFLVKNLCVRAYFQWRIETYCRNWNCCVIKEIMIASWIQLKKRLFHT